MATCNEYPEGNTFISENRSDTALTAPGLRERQVKIPGLFGFIKVFFGHSPRVDLDTNFGQHIHDLTLDGGAELIALDEDEVNL